MEESDVTLKVMEIEEKIETIKEVLNDIYFDEKELMKYNDAYYIKENESDNLILVKAIDKGINEIIINENTKCIMENAFNGCSNIKKIIVPEGVVLIGEKAFMDCKDLEEIILPNSLVKIGKNFVSGCEKLKYNTYKNGKYLGNNENPYLALISPHNSQVESYEIHFDAKIIFTTAFDNCQLLTSINIPEKVTSICTMAFSLKNNVGEIDLPKSVKYIDDYAFVEAKNIKTISLPKDISFIKEKALIECNELQEIKIDKNNKNYECEDGVLYTKNKTKIINYPMAKRNEVFQVNDSVEEISNFAFSKNRFLKTIKLNDKLKKIGQFSFENANSLKKIELNEQLKEINTCAFFNCKKLETIVFPKGQQCEFIQRGAFSRCENLQYFIVSDSVKKIGINAFSNCDQLKIYLTENVDHSSNVIKKANPDNRNVYLKKQWKFNVKNEPILIQE